MKSHLGSWRLLGLLVALAGVAVAIPAASGAGPFARGAGSKSLCAHACSAAKVVSPSILKKAMGKPAGPHGPGNTYTCTNGSIPTGTYDSLTITGQCAVDEGIVKVKHDVNVMPNAGLLAAFGGGPALSVGGNLNVKSNAVLFLGCEPYNSICFNDPDQNVGSLKSRGTVFGSLHADNAFAVVVHNSSIGRDLTIHGGGGGLDCNTAGFLTTEDVAVGHNVTIEGVQTCWMGFFRTDVGGNFKYNNNANGDPDGNEIQTNVVKGNLDCHGNNPAAQGGDSGGFMNIAFGHATGECAALSGP